MIQPTKNLLAANSKHSLGPIDGPVEAFNPTAGINTSNSGDLIVKLITSVIGFLTIVAGLAFLLYFLMGGISWLTAGGERDRVEKAKNQMTSAVIGLIVVIASITIASIVGQVLGIDILFINQNPTDTINNFSPN